MSKNIFFNDYSTSFSFNPFYHEFILQKKHLWFWTIANCRSHSATTNYPDFLLFFIRSIPRVRRPTKNQIIASIAFRCEKNLGMLLTGTMVEKTLIATIDQKSCKLFLICGRKRIYSSIFGWFCMYHFSFTKLRLQGVARFLLCRSFSG